LNWILCGFKSCGKTYFGKKLGLPFIDIDDLIESEQQMPIRRIVLSKGMKYFRQIVQNTICNLHIENHIIAIGGGALENEKNRIHLQKLGTFIYLNCPKKVLKKRILTPPLPTFINSKKTFDQIYSQRIPQYETLSSHQIQLENKTDAQVLEALWQVINLDRSFGSPLGESLTAKP